jgi:hypothetical protein
MDHRPLAAVHGYRDVEYGVHERSPGDWQWTYYPKVGFGVKTQGSAKGSRDDAVSACKVAIDAWLGPQR